MKTIALIHTVQKVSTSFGASLQAVLPEHAKMYNILDEYLAKHPDETGEFTIGNKNRLYRNIKNAQDTGADVIVVTCSTLTPAVEEIRPFIAIPIIAIDDAMGREAVKLGDRICVLATAKSTLEPTTEKLRKEAHLLGKTITMKTQSIAPAYDAMRAMNMEEHDRLVKEAVASITNIDCIVLAQASMAHLESDVERISGCKTFSSPRLCMEEVKKVLYE